MTTERTEKRIKTLTEKVGISEEGRIWLEECLDPFTDQPRRAVGFPDLVTGNSIVQVIKQSITITTDTINSEDMHVFMDNIDTGVDLGEATLINGNVFYPTTAAPSIVRGGLVIRVGVTNTPLTNSSKAYQLTLPLSYLASGRARVISKGFEVHNITPVINQGGAIAVYRDSTTNGYQVSGVGNVVPAPSLLNAVSYAKYPLAQVPETPAQAMLIPGTKQWEARDGCYCVATMSEQTNQPAEDDKVLVVSTDSSTPSGKIHVNLAAGSLVPLGTTVSRSPFFVSGAYMTGLPPSSSLLINFIIVLERFVDQSNLDLIVLSSPSPYLDVVAQELYAKAAHRLPAGVKVNENDSGDWIRSVADVLQDFGVPGMSIVKGGVDLVKKLSGSERKTAEHADVLESILKRLEAMERSSPINNPTYIQKHTNMLAASAKKPSTTPTKMQAKPRVPLQLKSTK